MAQQPEQSPKVESWAYPFPLKATNSASAPEAYLAALAAAEDGFYPIGANGLWHGGIHFGAGTAGKFAQDGGVKCIADGEVVAFRLDSKLQGQELAYPDGSKAGYSKGFTLVRHRLVLPTPPSQTANVNGSPQNAPASAPPEDVLTFFSLYMHTLPLEGYSASTPAQGHAKTLPAYYGASEIYSVGDKAHDPRLSADGHPDNNVTGLRVRASSSAHAAVVGWLASGTKVKVGQKHGGWGKIASFVSGTVESYKEGSSVPANASSGWVFLGEMAREAQPSAVDQVYILPKPYKISAGETVAYIGEYQRLVEARAHHTLPPKLGERPLLHVEVFTGDDLEAYILRSRTRAQQLDPKSRSLLLISKGAKLVQPSSPDTSIPSGTTVKAAPDSPNSGPWCKVQKVDASGHPIAGPAIWIARSDLQSTGARQGWSQFPLSVQSAGGSAAAWTRVAYTASAQHCVEAANKTWYAVSIADENNAQVDGWVCDHGHPLVELKSPWDWPGFDIVSLGASVSDMFQRALFIADSGTPDEITRFENAFKSARSDATIARLEDAIDGQGQNDGKITADELQLALGKSWLADRIDHLIVRYESEWGGEMSKWDALDSHMHAGLPVWQAEKKRIDALRFWPSVASIDKFPSSATVCHIHPLGIAGNFKGSGFRFTIEQLKHLFPDASNQDIQAVVDELNAHIDLYQLNRPLRRCHLFAQIQEEVGTSLSVPVESLNYSSSALTLFGYFVANPHEATLYGRTHDHPADQAAIANRAYANSDSNGGVATGDGWSYRGRGYIQLTHRGGYRRFTTWNRANRSNWPSEADVDFEANPDRVAEIRYAVRSACFFWVSNGLYEKADAGSTPDNVDSISKSINPGLFKNQDAKKREIIQDRRDNFARIFNWGGFNE